MNATQLVKYGVVSLHDALRDLWGWEDLYLAGRLHKPTRQIIRPACACLEDAMLYNRRAAATAALLLLPPEASLQDVVATIVGLSYSGVAPSPTASPLDPCHRYLDGMTPDSPRGCS